MRHQHDSFTNSGLGRAKPQRRVFRSFINNNLKRNRSQMGLVEDRTSSTTIVRIIIGLLMLHLVIIGGVLLKGRFDKMAGGAAVSRSLTPPPSVAPQPAPQAEEVLPQPTAPAVAAAPAAGNHITQPAPAEAAAAPQAPELFPEDGAAVAAPEPAPVVVAPTIAEPAAPAAPAPAEAAATATIKHHINSGDTWYGLSKRYNVSMDALKAANPAAARKDTLFAGEYLNVPVTAEVAAAQAASGAAPAAPAEETATTHTVQRGDTLAKIARKYKMSVPALMKLNNLTEKDARRIKIGQELRVRNGSL